MLEWIVLITCLVGQDPCPIREDWRVDSPLRPVAAVEVSEGRIVVAGRTALPFVDTAYLASIDFEGELVWEVWAGSSHVRSRSGGGRRREPFERRELTIEIVRRHADGGDGHSGQVEFDQRQDQRVRTRGALVVIGASTGAR